MCIFPNAWNQTWHSCWNNLSGIPAAETGLWKPKEIDGSGIKFFFFLSSFSFLIKWVIIWQLLAMKLLKYRNHSRKSLGKRKWWKWNSHKDRNQLVCSIGWVAWKVGHEAVDWFSCNGTIGRWGGDKRRDPIDGEGQAIVGRQIALEPTYRSSCSSEYHMEQISQMTLCPTSGSGFRIQIPCR